MDRLGREPTILAGERPGTTLLPDGHTYWCKTMSRWLLWITTAVLGAAATLMTSFGLLAAILFLLLAVPLVIRGDRLVALSGLLTGFGGFWSLLMARQLSSGGTLDNATFWIAVGVVPLAIGLTLLVGTVARALGARQPVGR